MREPKKGESVNSYLFAAVEALDAYFSRLYSVPLDGPKPLGAVVPIRNAATKAAKKPVPAWRKLHGKYLGAIRPLNKVQRAKVRAIQQTKGYRASIAAAKKMRGK